jgi:DNA integrity scanning protein DisA with diadenylate cyclase activity
MKKMTKGKQEKILILHAYSIAEELGIDTVIIQACGRHEVDFLEESTPPCRHVWLTKNPDALPITPDRFHSIIKVPKIATGDNFLSLGYFLALLAGEVNIHKPIISITADRTKQLNGLSITSTVKKLAWLTDDHLEDFAQIDNPQTLVMLINLAMRFAKEGREGRPIGTCFILADLKEVSKYTWQLILNPCSGYPHHIRNIFREEFFETMRELSALDGAFLVNPSGEVRAAAVYMATPESFSLAEPGLGARHNSAIALTTHTNAITVVLSESSGTITVYGKGKKLLQFIR